MAPALIVAASLVLLLRWQEPAHQPVAPNQHASLRHFIKRSGTTALMGTAFFSAVAMVAGYGLAKLVLIDAGWPIERIAQVGMLGGVMTVLLGYGDSFIGGIICALVAMALMFRLRPR